MPRVLIADAVSDAAVAVLKKGGVDVEKKTGLTEEQVCAEIVGYEGLIVRSATKVTAKVLASGKKLKIVGRAGAGVDNIDVAAAVKAGVIVENTPGGNTTSAGEHAVALMFALSRHIAPADREMRAGQWPKKGLTGVELTGKTLGLLGLGRVASVVAKVGRALDMTVLVFDPYITDARAAEFGAKKVALDALLPASDFISVHSPLTPETKHLIGPAQFAKMKKTVRLVNAARGGIVDEAALLEALKSGKIAGAAMDVFETEPLPADSPFRSLPNVVLTPHLGASTEEAQERVAVEIAEQFVAYFSKGEVRNAVKTN
ncbi:MAG: D-3-phosphoglycerate [Planctomycetota bacterium]|nr:MAG: D-3-phosphoglycerate [Planctomycetota bacterium]